MRLSTMFNESQGELKATKEALTHERAKSDKLSQDLQTMAERAAGAEAKLGQIEQQIAISVTHSVETMTAADQPESARP